MQQKISIGRIVHYQLTTKDALAINDRRASAKNLNAANVTLASQKLGPVIHTGNDVREGQSYPAIVVAVFSDSQEVANLQVFLDGNDTYWATSRHEADEPGAWHWPPRN